MSSGEENKEFLLAANNRKRNFATSWANEADATSTETLPTPGSGVQTRSAKKKNRR
jgi:hypothetical protein